MLGLGYRKRFRTKKASGKRTHQYEPKLAGYRDKAECIEKRLARFTPATDTPKPPAPVKPLCVIRLQQTVGKALASMVPPEALEPANAPQYDAAVLADLLSGHHADDD